ncbi:hypothetical protein ABZ614_16760 [Streptomyces sp. NPDC013178]|uniref:hypothetical protein n=1 Tax=unclassified Streptomyces TaxID=2593676 RepID=UPI0033E53DF0
MTSRILIRSGFVASIAAAAFALQIGPASASTTVSVKTTDGGAIGGTAIVWGDSKFWVDESLHDRETLGACDKQADGLRVWAVATYPVGDHFQAKTVEDADGAGNGCKHLVLPNIPEGKTIEITACLKDGADGTPKYCGRGKAIA